MISKFQSSILIYSSQLPNFHVFLYHLQILIFMIHFQFQFHYPIIPPPPAPPPPKKKSANLICFIFYILKVHWVNTSNKSYSFQMKNFIGYTWAPFHRTCYQYQWQLAIQWQVKWHSGFWLAMKHCCHGNSHWMASCHWWQILWNGPQVCSPHKDCWWSFLGRCEFLKDLLVSSEKNYWVLSRELKSF